ncbi:uncharacterized protein LOC113009796 [Astatotilapia calliptera]|uniref:uncharacterized protein LOC113009796 n=1 Tax=Astatotilapia calliptera TaxID=8154 RepID=UPI000E42A01B|nr:uncharacterized protein LOC113009796 [Astatotilapia calliptera]XP_026004140.1 uncharacterized protein LOC113009796 [Astatotilapia calliptera]XP_026004150.1 uncharacterized protein LOC113009796 [Astatotilapia calliptera]XP_026004160.1 uncharacterized protein LOC113009796 [Astatotilapia calliptera]
MKSFVPFLLLVHVSQHASGVEVYEGEESVLLPCQVPVNVSSSSTAVVWDRDEFKIPTVHMRVQSGDDILNDQNHRYTNRTSMKADALQTGDLSLTLRNPTVSDGGTYTCIVRKYGQDQSKTHVQLKVKERPPTWLWALFVVLAILALLAVSGIVMCYRYKWIKRPADSQVLMVEMLEGDQKSVLLPFKTTEDLPQDATVEWTLTDPKHMQIHVYDSGKNQPDKQDEVYQGRTEMNEEPLRDKDLSLKLKEPRVTDTGVYTCTVSSKDGSLLLQKVVSLTVRESQMETVEVTEWNKSVLLPFKTKDDLSQDATVEWRRSDSKHRKVHMFQSSQHLSGEQDEIYRGRTEMNKEALRIGDLSLTLKDLRLTDSGVYTCTVYKKDGAILKQKVVVLSVRVYELQTVEVTRGVKRVMLPFKTTADLPEDVRVEWRRTDLEDVKVLMHENHQKKHEEQHQDYQGRTEMKEELLRTGDLSLTLNFPRLTDSGVYTCTVYRKDGAILKQKVVILTIRDYQVEIVEVTKGKKSVLLPFKTTPGLPDDVTVEWRRADTKVTVHTYQDGQNLLEEQGQDYRGRTEMNEEPLRTGDLSLTLKDLQKNHSGFYMCTVSQGEDILRQKGVTLTFRGKHGASFTEQFQGFRKKKKSMTDGPSSTVIHESIPLTTKEAS